MHLPQCIYANAAISRRKRIAKPVAVWVLKFLLLNFFLILKYVYAYLNAVHLSAFGSQTR